MTRFSRRDFLKIAGITLAGALTTKKTLSLNINGKRPNIIIILMDALSARHMSLYGYPRLTTPNIDAFAENAKVFHNHYSGSNFTTAGTASMLTGMLPWKHRAINYGGLVRSEFVKTNPYTLLGADYHRFGFTQNTWVDHLMGQYDQDVDRLLSPLTYSLIKDDLLMQPFENDRTIASIAINDFLLSMEGLGGPAGSSVIGYFNKSRVLNYANDQISARYPKGVPEAMSGIPYLNEEIYKGIYLELARLASESHPYFAYFHLYSPHFPYKPRSSYRDLFRDSYKPAEKPVHPFSPGLPDNYVLTQRTLYDRQVAQLDDEFGKLIQKLKESGMLDNSYLIFTSDHGELFERGFFGHASQYMYESVLRIPLMIRAPGQTTREDVFAPTSNIDILPTLLSIAGKNPAPDTDGKILPGFGGEADEEDRPIFSMTGIDNPAFGPIKKAVICMRKRSHKLIAYLDYDLDQPFELYDIENDPDELNNLASKDAKTFAAMKDELFTHLNEANRSFTDK
jgi:arylsulfatase A-like enzyme